MANGNLPIVHAWHDSMTDSLTNSLTNSLLQGKLWEYFAGRISYIYMYIYVYTHIHIFIYICIYYSPLIRYLALCEREFVNKFELSHELSLTGRGSSPKKLLGSGVSTPHTLFCLICTIHSELKYFPIFTHLSESSCDMTHPRTYSR